MRAAFFLKTTLVLSLSKDEKQQAHAPYGFDPAGATAPERPLASSALRTTPDAFASSRNALT